MPRGCALHNDTEGGAGVADWQKIKTEYITTDTSYRKLAQKHGINATNIAKRASAEGWVELRKQNASKTLAKTIEKISEQQSSKEADRVARINDLTDRLLDKVEQAITELDRHLCKEVHKEKIIEYNNPQRADKPTRETTHEEEKVIEVTSAIDRLGLKQVASALRDIQEIQMRRTQLDEEEQRARIENLRRNAQKDDSKNGGKITVVLEGALEEYAG